MSNPIITNARPEVAWRMGVIPDEDGVAGLDVVNGRLDGGKVARLVPARVTRSLGRDCMVFSDRGLEVVQSS